MRPNLPTIGGTVIVNIIIQYKPIEVNPLRVKIDVFQISVVSSVFNGVLRNWYYQYVQDNEVCAAFYW